MIRTARALTCFALILGIATAQCQKFQFTEKPVQTPSA